MSLSREIHSKMARTQYVTDLSTLFFGKKDSQLIQFIANNGVTETYVETQAQNFPFKKASDTKRVYAHLQLHFLL